MDRQVGKMVEICFSNNIMVTSFASTSLETKHNKTKGLDVLRIDMQQID